MLRHIILGLVGFVCVGALVLAGMIIFGGPPRPPVNAKLAADDELIHASLADMPARQSFKARDGVTLSYRAYPGARGGGVAVLVHGSSGSNSATHTLAKALSAAGIGIYSIDVRGHGASGPHGDIAYYGQLDDDIADLARKLDKDVPNERRLLIGHSSGGGFVLRVAGSKNACAFDGFLALSPYLNYQSTTNRAIASWSGSGTARIAGLVILNQRGIHAFDNLPALNFAIPADLPNRTPTYSWRLMRNFGLDTMTWKSDLAAIDRPTRVIAGVNDDLFYAERYRPEFAKLQPRIAVSLVPGVDHMGMVIDPRATAAVTLAAKEMLAAPSPGRCAG